MLKFLALEHVAARRERLLGFWAAPQPPGAFHGRQASSSVDRMTLTPLVFRRGRRIATDSVSSGFRDKKAVVSLSGDASGAISLVRLPLR